MVKRLGSTFILLLKHDYVYCATDKVTGLCTSLTSCAVGGMTSNMCDLSKRFCPSCVTFENGACFEKLNSTCPFGIDCDEAWGQSNTSKPVPPPSKPTTPIAHVPNTPPTSGSKGTAAPVPVAPVPASPVPSSPNDIKSAPSQSTEATPKENEPINSSGSNSNISVMFAIIGAAIGVVAVAIIFLTLVRRSRVARDDEDNMASTPPEYKPGPPQNDNGSTNDFMRFGNNIETRSTTSMVTTPQNRTEEGLANGVANYYSQVRPSTTSTRSSQAAGIARPASNIPVPMGYTAPNAYRPGYEMATSVPTYSVLAPPMPQIDGTDSRQSNIAITSGMDLSPRLRRESYEF